MRLTSLCLYDRETIRLPPQSGGGGGGLPPIRDESGTILIQSGKNAIIDWESFSISQDERVRFQQTGVDSYVLNRVVGNEPSALFGTLQSNGAVYLVNPNGILIGPSALIETAGFIASVFDALSEDLSDKIFRFRGDSKNSVVNQGKITSAVGDVFLIGRTVENSGTITAKRQGLLSGCDVLIRPTGAPEVLIRTDGNVDEKLLKENPYALAIRHSGKSSGEEAYFVASEGLCVLSGSVTMQTPERGGIVHVLGG